MKYLKLSFFIFYMIIPSISNSQHRIYLSKISNPKKTKTFKLHPESTIKTTADIINPRIFAVTDSSLILVGEVPTGRDTIYIQKYFSRPSDSTTVHITKTDTINVSFDSILYIRRDLFKNKKWMEPIQFAALPAMLGLIALPIAAIALRDEAWDNYVRTEGILIGATIVPIFVGTIGRKFDTQKKWRFTTAKNNVR